MSEDKADKATSTVLRWLCMCTFWASCIVTTSPAPSRGEVIFWTFLGILGLVGVIAGALGDDMEIW